MDSADIRLHYRNMDAIPTYALYGEQESETDWLHWESIQARSKVHGYRIAPHRHEQFLQVLLLNKGSGTVSIDGATHALEPVSAVIVPALIVHGYDFSEDVDGVVVTLMERDLRNAGLPLPPPMVLSRELEGLSDACRRLIAEARTGGAGHDLAMRAHLTLLAVEIGRAAHEDALERAPDRALTLTRAFRDLVEERFRDTRRIADYASAIGISPTHLNRVCRQVTGSSALGLVERRIALEARRMLLFSGLPIKQIGSELGYDDPAYFSRFLTRALGKPPGVFRRERS